jgi:hypothetical protein
MLVVETIAKIRRLHLGQGLPIEAICRQLGLSRKVMRKVPRSGATEFRYERAEQPQPKLGAWRDDLDRLLAENAGRASRDTPHWGPACRGISLARPAPPDRSLQGRHARRIRTVQARLEPLKPIARQNTKTTTTLDALSWR